MLYYRIERPHQGLGNEIIEPDETAGRVVGEIKCRERPGGLLTYYYRDAARACRDVWHGRREGQIEGEIRSRFGSQCSQNPEYTRL